MYKIIGTEEKYYPSQLHREAGVVITILLVEGAIGDYAAYAGAGDVHFVASVGNKLSFHDAQSYFPYIEESKYRS